MTENTFHPQIEYSKLNKNSMYVIDVRSPEEFEEFHIPNSINVPLFSNEERKEIGTIYKQVSPGAAKKRGLFYYANKLPQLYDSWIELEERYNGKHPVVMCARGGMRSRAFVSMMRTMGINAFQLTGGIRSIREDVRKKLEYFSTVDWNCIVIAGNTGTGKTEWLRRLKEKNYPVIDLEGFANHRGSIFGHIGLPNQSQKQFEYELVHALNPNVESKTIIIEAESKRIGKIIVPPFLIKRKEMGQVIEIVDCMEKRVERIEKEYKPTMYHEEIIEAYACIRKRLSKDAQLVIDDSFSKKDYKEAFTSLLSNYYDPKYDFKMRDYHSSDYCTINISKLTDAEALQGIESHIKRYL
ncbi:tRNA 2-selenouridine(34) synthase MnmH [Evansella sp. AB-P1]|uniref:tRNA 2-selenouridine(34) synthase MnmH n=1 Tax=Evansella sp. AB-P1 TaxID=3037653 RepID=UPI0024200E48|nr:tRNA 2-selenouridine(34) synthase MnmH [Evansella sp. AB-P1]MDG5789050.1 tRNA 2-selenouridine(34) synthase MnmH [Evansella sp. AB-P1]